MTARNTTLPTDSKQSPHIPLPLPASAEPRRQVARLLLPINAGDRH